MLRFSLLSSTFLMFTLSLQAQTAADESFENRLIVQRAIVQAQNFLIERQPKKAVEILEVHLPRINGNAAYLRLLRDAYRNYHKELVIAQQTELANKYLARLSILDNEAADEYSKKTGAAVSQVAAAADKNAAKGSDKYYQRVTLDESKTGAPLVQLTPEPADPSAVRRKQETDPFDLENQRFPAARDSADRKQLAKSLLSQADAEFNSRHFEQARILYGRAFEADQYTAAQGKERWAYCILNNVVEQLNSNKLDSLGLKKLTDEVRCAVAMSPALANTGRWISEEIETRRTAGARPATGSTIPQLAIQHSQSNGWQISESQWFRVHHKQQREFGDQVAGIAERTRVEVLRKWFGGSGVAWRGKCDIYLHATAQAYASSTGVAASSPGHSRIETDAGTVISRRMDLRCDISNLLHGVLPHETTHVVLAGQFGKYDVPRWADEGMAVLSEPADAVAQHRRNLAQSVQSRQAFTLRELMHLNDYPQSQRVSVFYAQSVDVVAFMTELRGPLVFAEFLRDGLQTSYEQALRRHYGLATFDDLQARWQQQAIAAIRNPAGDNNVASGR